MAKRRWINWGGASGAESVNLSQATPVSGQSGVLGGIYETGHNRYQFVKLVDGAGADGDVVYRKAYTGVYEVTTTIGNASIYEVAGIITTTVTQNYYTNVKLGGTHNVKANGVFAAGMPVWPDTGSNRIVPGGIFSGALTDAGDAAGDVYNLTNPLTGKWIIDSVFVTTTTKSTAASTLDIGIAANATTLNDGLIDGLDVGTATVTDSSNFKDGGTNGKAAQIGAAGTVLTVSEASGNVDGLVGTIRGTFYPDGHPHPPSIGTAQGTISGGKVSVALDIPYW